MKEKYKSFARWILKFIILVCIFIFLFSIGDMVDDWKMNRYIKKERELRKNDVPNNVTRGIHPRPDTTRKDTIRNGNN